MNRLVYYLAVAALLVSAGTSAEPAQADRKAVFRNFIAESPDRIPIILRSRVEVDERATMSLDSKLDMTDKGTREERARQMADQHFAGLMSRLSGKARTRKLSTFRDPRLRSLTVSADELDRLLSDPDLEVYPNRYHRLALDQSVPLVFPNQSVTEFDGSGMHVALLDTGVNLQHEFLAGAINTNAAACFSNDDGVGVGASLCPGGAGTVIAAGAANACDSSIPACQHGTQMAGIIAGAGLGMSGVASGASIIPIQVFTSYSEPSNPEHITACGDITQVPCVRALTSDMIRALEYVDQVKSVHDIGAVNISFGADGPFQGQCDGSAAKPLINAITAGGTAVIASSGNDGNANAMRSPACISSVISVASTNINDTPSAFNNRSSELDFFAPGEAINTSSLPLSSYADAIGTSAAAAHVSGAWAVLKEKNPGASVATVKDALESTGIAVTQNSFTKPRIDIEAALSMLTGTAKDEEFCFPMAGHSSGDSASPVLSHCGRAILSRTPR